MLESTSSTTFENTANISTLPNRSNSFSATLSRTSSSLFDTFKKSGSLCLNNIKQTPLVSIAISPRAKATTTTIDSPTDIQSCARIEREHKILSPTKYKSMSSTEYRSLNKKKVKKRSRSIIGCCSNDNNTPSNLLTYDQVCTLHERYGLDYNKKEVEIQDKIEE